MTVWEILLIVGCALFVVGVAVAAIVRKKRGKGGCDCCSNCASCQHCSQSTVQNEKTDEKNSQK